MLLVPGHSNNLELNNVDHIESMGRVEAVAEDVLSIFSFLATCLYVQAPIFK